MRVYVAGPINGYENGNAEAFFKASQDLAVAGHTPVNPHFIPKSHVGECRGSEVVDRPHRFGCYMREDIRELIECDAILLLPGWEQSRGAQLEQQIAAALGLVFLSLPIQSAVIEDGDLFARV